MVRQVCRRNYLAAAGGSSLNCESQTWKSIQPPRLLHPATPNLDALESSFVYQHYNLGLQTAIQAKIAVSTPSQIAHPLPSLPP